MYKILFTMALVVTSLARATDYMPYASRDYSYNTNSVNQWFEKQQEKLSRDRQEDLMRRQTQALEDSVRLQKQYYYGW